MPSNNKQTIFIAFAHIWSYNLIIVTATIIIATAQQKQQKTTWTKFYCVSHNVAWLIASNIYLFACVHVIMYVHACVCVCVCVYSDSACSLVIFIDFICILRTRFYFLRTHAQNGSSKNRLIHMHEHIHTNTHIYSCIYRFIWLFDLRFGTFVRLNAIKSGCKLPIRIFIHKNKVIIIISSGICSIGFLLRTLLVFIYFV